MTSVLGDLRYGWRLISRNKGFGTIAILTLALGIGANTAMFSVVKAVLLTPFPYPHASEIMFLSSYSPQFGDSMPVTYPDFLDWQRDNRVFTHLGAARAQGFSLTDPGLEPANVRGATVSASVFPLLGITPQLGRVFRQDEDREGAPRVVVLSYGLWRDRYGLDRGILQRAITLDGDSYQVVGVMPAEFRFWAADLWVPVGLNFLGEFKTSRVLRSDMYAIGRLAPGVTRQPAAATMDVIAKRLERAYPDSNSQLGIRIVPLTESVAANMRPVLLLLLGSVALVLLIGCANVANLLMARAAGRTRELAVRTALGAGRGRLMRQLLCEAAPLAIAGTAAGLLVGYWTLHAMMLLVPVGSIPAEANVQIDAGVLAFTVGLSVLTALGTGILPAIQHSRLDPAEHLQQASRGSSMGRRGRGVHDALVVAEVALSLVLLAGAGLLLTSLLRLQSTALGFDPGRVLALQVTLPPGRYPEIHQVDRFYANAVERLAALTGVERIGAISTLPLSQTGSDMPIVIEGQTFTSLQDLPSAQFSVVLGDYFRAMSIPLRAGRLFDARDRETSPRVAIVNDALVQQFMQGGDPIGREILLGVPDNLMRDDLIPGIRKFEWLTVVGIVGNVRKFTVAEQPRPEAYLPYAQTPPLPIFRASMFLVARTAGDPAPLMPAAREQIWAIDRDQPIARLATMDALVGASLQQSRFSTTLLGFFAALATVLAAIGAYGVLSYTVARRTVEIGIRLALGAARRDILRDVMRHGLRMMCAGAMLGLAVTLALSRVIGGMLYEVTATDPIVLAGVTVLLLAVGALAAYVPARRAMRVDPMAALRAE